MVEKVSRTLDHCIAYKLDHNNKANESISIDVEAKKLCIQYMEYFIQEAIA